MHARTHENIPLTIEIQFNTTTSSGKTECNKYQFCVECYSLCNRPSLCIVGWLRGRRTAKPLGGLPPAAPVAIGHPPAAAQRCPRAPPPWRVPARAWAAPAHRWPWPGRGGPHDPSSSCGGGGGARLDDAQPPQFGRRFHSPPGLRRAPPPPRAPLPAVVCVWRLGPCGALARGGWGWDPPAVMNGAGARPTPS